MHRSDSVRGQNPRLEAGDPGLRDFSVALLVYLATCLTRHHLFDALFVVSRTITVCYIICHFEDSMCSRQTGQPSLSQHSKPPRVSLTFNYAART